KYISLGTNDLLQFFYGVDRTNERLAGMAKPLQVAFLRSLFYCIAAARAEGVQVGVCGEMAADPTGFLTLMGMGLNEFSMRPAAVPRILEMIPCVNHRRVTTIVQEFLAEGAPIDIKEHLQHEFPKIAEFIQDQDS
ncbi:MAG: phosphoenolpyruvate--protein phosphotransferase, partial [Zetaproteobacteria bacterium CG_4_9_14_3_um_filter_53_7]